MYGQYGKNMSPGSVLLTGLCLVSACSADYSSYRKWVYRAADNATLQGEFYKRQRYFHSHGEVNGDPFPCSIIPPSPTVPTSVSALRPGDIKVVGAMGDSITAGNGITATTIVGLLTEDRGLSWSIGGDGDYTTQPTIPNILKLYNPEVTGYAVKSGDVDSPNAHLDVAVPGSKAEPLDSTVLKLFQDFGKRVLPISNKGVTCLISPPCMHWRDMPEQAQMLIERMKSTANIDFMNDWKLVTIFIGANDLCDYCKDTAQYNSSQYIAHVKQALDILHEGLPRAFINLVEVIRVDQVKDLNIGIVCSVAHDFLCKCGAYPADQEAEDELILQETEYQDSVEKLVATGIYDDKDDFTVVVQPFSKETKIPRKDGKPDLSFLAPDCFHFSQKGHAAAAIALWNNMIQPLGEKMLMWEPGQTPDCPTEDDPFFFTSRNSPLR